MVNDTLSITSENLQDALDSRAVYGDKGTIHRLIEDPDWVEPEPAMPPMNPWRKIVPEEWPECKPGDRITAKFSDGATGDYYAANVPGYPTAAIEWRYAEGEK